MARRSPQTSWRASFRLVSPSRTPKAPSCAFFSSLLLLLAMAAVVYVLARGVIAMASGKDFSGEQSQMWMQPPSPLPGGRDCPGDPDPRRSPGRLRAH